MNTFLNFIVEVSVSLLLFYAIYYFLLRKETNFTFVRFYLLFSLVASLILPSIPAFQTSINTSVPAINSIMPAHWLPEIAIGNSQQSAYTWSVGEWLLLAYTVGVLLLFVRFLTEGFRLIKLIQRATTTRHQNAYVLEVNDDVPSFSFFHYIVIGNADHLTYEEREAVLAHEKIHKRQLHSIDTVLTTLITILFWFHPVVYQYRKALIQLHEFEADSRAVKAHEVDQYCGLLAKAALHSAGFTIAHHFTNSLILKRIAMIKSVKHTMAVWKKVLLIPACTLVFFVIACEDQVITDMQEVAKRSTIVNEFPTEVQKVVSDMKTSNPAVELLVIGIVDGDKSALDNLDKSVKANEIRSVHIIKPEIKTAFDSYIVIEKGSSLNAVSSATSDGAVFTVVEESAKPTGGYDAFTQFLNQNISYPSQALSNRVTGKVFVSFIVNEDGSLTDLAVIKGIGSGCDEEAIRVLKLTTRWIPGKQNGKIVKQRMVLPIAFAN